VNRVAQAITDSVIQEYTDWRRAGRTRRCTHLRELNDCRIDGIERPCLSYTFGGRMTASDIHGRRQEYRREMVPPEEVT
jgi:hypothetical protein